MEDSITPKKKVEEFLTQTENARYLSERDRDYVDNKQWTQEEESKLRARNQAAIVINRIKPKIEGLKGLLINRRTDPKAFPRTQAHEESAEVVTDALRYVADNVDLDEVELAVADNVFVEGYGGAIVNVKRAGDEIEVDVEEIPWDRIYFDPHSRRLDFKDAKYAGIIIWMDKSEAEAQFGTEILTDQSEFETFEDRPKWIDSKRDRVRVCQHFEEVDGQWTMCFFAGDQILKEKQPSPYLDEDDEPCNPIELTTAHIDRENNRFGDVRYWIDIQDEINKRRSKALHLLSVRQTASRRGAVSDVDALKRELSKPDGHIEYDGEQGDFEVLETSDMASAQFSLLEEAKRELDAVGFNAQLSGERQGDLSGRAVNLLQQAGTLELASTMSALSQWKKRIYRQIWYRIRQFWDKERWIRVTDDYKNLKWVGFNIEMTVQDRLEEIINDDSLPEYQRKEAAMSFVQMMQAQDPRLQQIIEVKNPIAELDMDIILDQTVDMINVQQEQFQILSQLAASYPGEVPFKTMLKLSSFHDKEDLIDELEEAQKQQAEVMQQQMAMQEQAMQAKVEQEMAIKQAEAQVEMEKERVMLESKTQAEFAINQQKLNSAKELKSMEIHSKEKMAAIDIMVEKDRAAVTNGIETFKRDLDERSVQKERDANAQMIAESMNKLAAVQSADVDKLVGELQRPKQVVRDESGKVTGLE